MVHRGHLELLRKGFDISSKVIIGLTSDEFAHRRGKRPINGYEQRYEILRETIEKNFKAARYEISRLDDDFGPAVLEKEVQALVVSEETRSQGAELNRLRRMRGAPDVDVIVVPMEVASDGRRISTTRIRNFEIDADGNILPVDK